MTCIKDKIIYIFPINFLLLTLLMVQSPILGNGAVQATPSLNLTNVLYVPKFSVSLLFISQFSKQNDCSVTFLSFLLYHLGPDN